MEEEQKAVARRSRKWIFLLVGVATFSPCHQTLPPSPQTVYEAARLKFQHGELIEAQADAEHAYDRYAQQSPEWASRFRVLRAEILLWRGMSNAALSLTSAELPA